MSRYREILLKRFWHPRLNFFFFLHLSFYIHEFVCVCIAKNCNQPFKTKLLEHTQPLATCRTPDFKPWKSASVVRLFPWKSLLVACISARSTPWRVWGETQWVAQLFPWVNLRKLQFDSWTLYLLSGTAPTDQDYRTTCLSVWAICPSTLWPWSRLCLKISSSDLIFSISKPFNVELVSPACV